MLAIRRSRRARRIAAPGVLSPRTSSSSAHRGLTLIEMLIATAVTLLMMAAVVNLFANLTGSIRNRRAIIEISAQMRQVRQRLALDLAGATCPANTWQRPGDDTGYLEIIEGRFSDSFASDLTDGNPQNGELDYATSIIPRNNLFHDEDGDGEIDDSEEEEHFSHFDGIAPSGLGDSDDILALTVRSENEPFVAQNPHGPGVVQSKLAEVVWFAVENPANRSLGEPGLRNIYRRAFLIAPWLPPIQMPPEFAVGSNPTAEQLAYVSNYYFQRYDISAHYDAPNNRWIPNTLGDLTRREYRCFRGVLSAYPHPLASGGVGYSSSENVRFERGPLSQLAGNATARALVQDDGGKPYRGGVLSYLVDAPGNYDDVVGAAVANGNPGNATARPVMYQIEPGRWGIATLTFGPAPLAVHRYGTTPNDYVDRTGEDLMMTDALAFDIKVYDPGAPVYAVAEGPNPNLARNTVEPGDIGWPQPGATPGNLNPLANPSPTSFGAFVDMGWAPGRYNGTTFWTYPDPSVAPANLQSIPLPVFNIPRQVGYHPRFDRPFSGGTQPFAWPFGWPAVYDTWSLHYESDGLDQDNLDGDNNLATGADEGTNGVDDPVFYSGQAMAATAPEIRDGPDDVMERETSPPYDTALRALKVNLRVYERDARQVRETSVTKSFMP